MFRRRIDQVNVRCRPRGMRSAAGALIAAILVLSGCSLGNLTMPGEEEDWLEADPIQTSLIPAVNPVVDLLKQARSFLNTDNMASVVLVMSSFQGTWENASAVIEPFAGEQWPLIEAAANRVITIFDGGSIPQESTARPAIEGLIDQLESLVNP